MFSPKVLDRANTIEFRVAKRDMELFLTEIKKLDMDALKAKGADMANSFLSMTTK
jgi:5-methylcytosine-specific restriction enzyme B